MSYCGLYLNRMNRNISLTNALFIDIIFTDLRGGVKFLDW